MIVRGQGQKAGDNSSQVQVSGDLVIVQGVTEDRAREIARESAREAIDGYTVEAQTIAAERIARFDGILIDGLARQGLLGAMADPAFQVALRKAQIGAASTERDNDYDILAALIEDRAKRADDRPVRAGINRAIEIVDQMDSQALRGLTVYAAAAQYSPLNGDVDEGLGAMDRMLEQLSEGLELPSGRAWIEHLDVLGAVRQDSIQSFKKLADYWTEKTPGYLSVGLPAGAEEGTAAIAELRDVHRISVAPVPHTFKPGYERLPFTGSNGFRSLLVGAGKSDAEAEAAAAVASSAYKLDERDDSLVPAYRERLCTLPTLNQIAGWWDEFAVFFSVTPVGSVVARANSKRLDKAGFLPPIE